ncbi:phospholipase D-like domain-containing protein [Lyngbya confervoides]|uniref:phospholipase D n=1 Tax=Lyngbya confervoides BDU141951 TaxID=1574623 RepID=A0ABD4T137_9CYAN|nr:phospholipase D-like domain-containing protein [Lyngbya confervoides]MCM1982310.1 phospholipase D-like domain-containing protein [Lyngbya confervoides BDU141951]
MSYAGLPCLLLGLGLWGWIRWQAEPVLFERGASVPQHQLIQAYFNQNPHASYRDPYRHHQRRGDNLEQILVDQIQSAQSQVEVAVQELRSPLIAQALRERHQHGVKVRLVLENTYSRPYSRYSEAEVAALDEHLRSRYVENLALLDRNQDRRISAAEAHQWDALAILQQAKVPWLDDTADGSKGSGLVHHKFVVIDGQRVVVTSANFTLSDLHGDLHQARSQGNANSLLVIQSPAVAQAFQAEFELLWGNPTQKSRFGVSKPHRAAQQFWVGNAQVWVKFSPDSATVPWEQTSNGLIHQQLTQGKSRIDLALFVFSEQSLANTLATVHQQGVKVRALIDRSFAFRPYSEGLDLLGVALPQRTPQASPCQVEVDNRPWPRPIATVGTPKLQTGDLLHHKFAVVDQTRVVMGSHNWSDAANRLNDETLVAIVHPTVAAHYQQEFERLYTNARLGLPPSIQSQWQAFRQQCGFSPGKPTNASPEHQQFSRSQPSVTLINLNQASQQELEQLPGIGPKTAQAIMTARQVQPFRDLADLDRVPGIGPKTLQQIRDRVRW